MDVERKVRILEGLGYAAALMVGVGSLTDVRVLDYFNALGLVFAIVVIVRLMVMNVKGGMAERMYEPPEDLDSDLTDIPPR